VRLSGTRLPDDGGGECFMASAVPVPVAQPASAAAAHGGGTTSFERMASAVTHDMNNALSSLTGYCHVLRESIGGNARALSDLGGVEAAAERTAAIVRQLSALGLRQMVRPVTLDPARRIETREPILRGLLPQGVDLQITTVRAGCEISIDPDVFDEIVMILTMNAQNSMPDGGWLHVRTSAAP